MRARLKISSHRGFAAALAVVVVASVAVTASVAAGGGSQDVLVRSTSQPVVVAPAKGAAFMSAVSDPARHRVYATWGIGYGNSPRTRIYVAVSRDGGRTFARPVWIARDNAAWMSAIRVDSSGRVWVTWTHFDQKHLMNPKDKYSNPSWQELAYSDDAGRTWSKPVDVPADHGLRHGSAFGALAVSPSGKMVTAFWIDYLPVWDGRVKSPAARRRRTSRRRASTEARRSGRFARSRRPAASAASPSASRSGAGRPSSSVAGGRRPRRPTSGTSS